MTVEWNRQTRKAISKQVGNWERSVRFTNGIGGNVHVGEAVTHVEVVPTRFNRLLIGWGIQEVHVYDTKKGIQKFGRLGKSIRREKFPTGGLPIQAW